MRAGGEGRELRHRNALGFGGSERPNTQRRAVARAEIADELKEYVATQPASRCTTPWLHSQVMRRLLADGLSPAGWSFAAVDALCGEILVRKGHRWYLPPASA